MMDAVMGVMTRVVEPFYVTPGYEYEKFPDSGRPSLRPQKAPIQERTFPGIRRRARFGGEEVCFAEVYWADFARVGTGTLALIVEFVRMVYGLRHLAVQASWQRGKFVFLMNFFLRMAVALLQGPILALYLFQGAQAFFYLTFLPAVWPEKDGWRSGDAAIMAALGIVAAAAGAVIWIVRRRDRLWRMLTWQCLIVVGIGAVVFAVLRGTGNESCAVKLLKLLPGEPLSEQKRTDWPFYLDATERVMDFLLSGVPVCLLIGFLCFLFSAIVSVMTRRPGLREQWAACLATGILCALWEVAMEPINLAVQWAYDKIADPGQPKLFTFWYYEATLYWLILCLVVSLAVTAVLRETWTRRRRAGVNLTAKSSDLIRDDKPPRLIVAHMIQLFVIIYVLVDSILAVLDEYRFPVRIAFLPYPAVYAMIMTILVTGTFVSKPLRNVMHVLTDIIIHFATPASNSVFPLRHRGPASYPIREQIANRFDQVFERVLSEHPSDILVIAHSQGSIIALEGLCRQAQRQHNGPRITLITFGSPLSHLYQFYFPQQYPPLDQAMWKRVHRYLTQWVNVYREDDYVGTDIKLADGFGPTNIACSPAGCMRGHTSYWKEDVFKKIVALLPGWHEPGDANERQVQVLPA
jgi:hypothetical protein